MIAGNVSLDLSQNFSIDSSSFVSFNPNANFIPNGINAVQAFNGFVPNGFLNSNASLFYLSRNNTHSKTRCRNGRGESEALDSEEEQISQVQGSAGTRSIVISKHTGKCGAGGTGEVHGTRSDLKRRKVFPYLHFANVVLMSHLNPPSPHNQQDERVPPSHLTGDRVSGG
ncbi:hypothetical protein JOM56_014141 [Amanita muscaria]